jgi:Flp pilus assembly pilin Flp
MTAGQTMTEYALILAAVAVVVFVGYQTMGTDIQGLLNSVDANL